MKYTDEQLAFLKLNQTVERKQLTADFNRRFNTAQSVTSIKSVCKRYGFKTGRTGRFEKGNIPNINSYPKGPNKTSFKKGHRPHNWKPIGTERITEEGYLQRKVTDTGNTVKDYVEVHRLVWEKQHGKIPPGHIIIFKDGDKTNITIDNLMMIKRSEHAVINKAGLANVEPELKETAVAFARLKTQVRKAKTQ